MPSDNAPAHLSTAAKKFWRDVLDEHNLEPHEEKLLLLACENLSYAEEAHKLIEREGLVIVGRDGPKPHPARTIERDAALTFAKIIKQLGLSNAPSVGAPTAYELHRRRRQ